MFKASQEVRRLEKSSRDSRSEGHPFWEDSGPNSGTRRYVRQIPPKMTSLRESTASDMKGTNAVAHPTTNADAVYNGLRPRGTRTTWLHALFHHTSEQTCSQARVHVPMQKTHARDSRCCKTWEGATEASLSGSGRAKLFRAEVVAESNRILALVAGRSRTVTRFARNGYSLSLVTVTRYRS